MRLFEGGDYALTRELGEVEGFVVGLAGVGEGELTRTGGDLRGGEQGGWGILWRFWGKRSDSWASYGWQA